MKVFVFGGSEGLGEHVLKALDAKGHEVVTVAEAENRAEELKMIGADEVIISKDEGVGKGAAGVDAIIYIAGASQGAGENQGTLVDHEAVIESLEAAQREKVERIVYLSPVRLDESEESKKTGGKHKPEEWIKKSAFSYTVIRTVKTVSKPGNGTIEAGETVDADSDEIPHEDVAAVLVGALGNKHTFNRAFEVAQGKTEIEEALSSL
ncbi:NAD(P)H-binding protein [Salinicoccus luteus]|uniref:NAD(P)H-binding protein n=1 Tax=Salinicoccus luteus TaxID=367840 RepID=UPI0004E1F121|nr:NAD(P)H-binding protein [Salinicoccus luteus]